MLLLIPLFPFLGFLVNAFAGRRLSKAVSGGVACLAMLASLVAASAAAWQIFSAPVEARLIEQTVYTWISSGDFQVPLTLRLDPLGTLMTLVVTGIGFLIHVYSTAYMHEETDGEYARYFSYLNLFAFFMLVLVLAANFLVMFVGWEGVGLCSYLLIGFWFKKQSATDAGKKAFIVNRVGDFAFLVGMMLLFREFGTLDFREVAFKASALSPEVTFGLVSLTTLLFFIGATGKSAQIPLYVWLPDAMEGPTPVSALIHAATMVTAGVYMIGRNAELFSLAPQTLQIVAVVGVVTALFAGTIGLVQNDIKRVLAYSTVSQLGFMFLAMGVGAFAAGIFHLYTHAFFKALMFLGSGAVIHALHGEQDMRHMGGLKKALPITYWTFLAGALAIVGFPALSGFFSKDEILFRTFYGGHQVLWAMGAVTSLLTAVYMFRLVYMTFHGAPRSAAGGHGADHKTHLHDAPTAMAIPLVLLAVGSIFAGYVGVPHVLGGSNRIEGFLEPSFHPAAHASADVGPAGVGPADVGAADVGAGFSRPGGDVADVGAGFSRPGGDVADVGAGFSRPNGSRPEGSRPAGAEFTVAHGSDPVPGAPAAAGHAGEPAAHGAADAHGDAEKNRLEGILMAVSVLIAFLGIGIATVFFLRQPQRADALAASMPGVHRLLLNKWYVDEAYDAAIVRPIKRLSTEVLWKGLDVRVIDAAVNGTGSVVSGAAALLRLLQTGSVRAYAAWLFVGVLLVVGYYLVW